MSDVELIATPPVRSPRCDCVKAVDARFEPMGYSVAVEYRTGAPLIYVRRVHVDSVRRTPHLVASFCPFCGEPYQ